ncbi:MAG: hypothetical protein N3D10_00290 [Candidatus Micrarchaeota archaeon]|nr:hypothetical protein [Candidatus Micrarchaeota archaeon]
MEDIKALKEEMENKTKQKIEILKELRKVNLQIKKLREELQRKTPSDKKADPDLIAKKIEKLEFYISTSAFTAAQEKEAIKKIEQLKKELEENMKNKEEWEAIKKLKAELKEQISRKNEIKKKLGNIIGELDEIYKKIIAYSSKAKVQKKQAKKEGKKEEKFRTQPQKEEAYLTLEDIVKMSQKEQK